MASVYDKNTPTREAGEDLSTKQYYFVSLNVSDQAVLPTAITDKAFGVLQYPAESTENAVVKVGDQTKVVAGEALALGDFVAPAIGGKAQVAVSTQFARGIVVEAAAADEDIAVIRLFDTAVALA